MGSVIGMVNAPSVNSTIKHSKPNTWSTLLKLETQSTLTKLLSPRITKLGYSDSENAWRKFHCSARQIINKQNQESSSEEENNINPEPPMSDAPESPLLPAMKAYHDKSIKENRDFLYQNLR